MQHNCFRLFFSFCLLFQRIDTVSRPRSFQSVPNPFLSLRVPVSSLLPIHYPFLSRWPRSVDPMSHSLHPFFGLLVFLSPPPQAWIQQGFPTSVPPSLPLSCPSPLTLRGFGSRGKVGHRCFSSFFLFVFPRSQSYGFHQIVNLFGWSPLPMDRIPTVRSNSTSPRYLFPIFFPFPKFTPVFFALRVIFCPLVQQSHLCVVRPLSGNASSSFPRP